MITDTNVIHLKSKIKSADMYRLAVYREQLRQNPRLLYLFFELTDKCNLHCIHCGSSCSDKGGHFLPLADIQQVLARVKETYGSQSVMICLTGGEPLLHPEFSAIVQTIAEMNFPWGITTNATLLDEQTLTLFQRCGLQNITLSVDGTQEENDSFRCKTGLYALLIEKIQLIRRYGIAVQVTTVVHKGNIDCLARLNRQLLAAGVNNWRLVNLEPIGRAMSHPELLLQLAEFKKLLDFIRELRYSGNHGMDVLFGCSHYLTAAYEHEVRDNYFLCGSGIYVASVLCNGDIFSCLDIERRPELIQGNVHTDDFIDVWENRFEIFRSDRTAACDICRHCESREFCAGDAAHTWDFVNNRPLLCYRTLEADLDFREKSRFQKK